MPQTVRCVPAGRRKGGRSGWGPWALLAPAALAAVSVGCAGSMTPLDSVAQYRAEVLQSRGPVLVEFYKTGCPACILLEPTLNDLSRKYAGRVPFLRFERVASRDVRATNDILWFPTVILYVNGVERKRWIAHYGRQDYVDALDAVAPPARALAYAPP